MFSMYIFVLVREIVQIYFRDTLYKLIVSTAHAINIGRR